MNFTNLSFLGGMRPGPGMGGQTPPMMPAMPGIFGGMPQPVGGPTMHAPGFPGMPSGPPMGGPIPPMHNPGLGGPSVGPMQPTPYPIFGGMMGGGMMGGGMPGGIMPNRGIDLRLLGGQRQAY